MERFLYEVQNTFEFYWNLSPAITIALCIGFGLQIAGVTLQGIALCMPKKKEE